MKTDETKLEYFFIEVDCTECTDGKYKIYNAYDDDYCEEITCEYCDGTCKMLKKIPVMGSDKKKKYYN